ncbi:hypothetical protein LEP1GSC085_2326 [Leptospira interrogans str. L0996]|nr:hypothetical protein LEP1GSC085_2326 [Leptospira interrogans str. L0996]
MILSLMMAAFYFFSDLLRFSGYSDVAIGTGRILGYYLF